MTARTVRRSTFTGAALAAGALVTGFAVPAQASNSYVVYGDGATLPSYTIKLADTGFNDPTRALFQNAVDQIHKNTKTRLTIAAGHVPENYQPAKGEIVVYLAAPGAACGSVTTWDGCAGPNRDATGQIQWNNSGWIKLKQTAFNADKGIEYRKSLIAHELGHALGLDHNPNDASQLMHPTVNSADAGTYKSGDIAGLNYLARHTQ